MKNQESFCRGTSLCLARYSILIVLLLVSPSFSATSNGGGQSIANTADSETPSLVQESLSRLLQASIDGSLPEDDGGVDDFGSLLHLDDKTVKRAPGWGKRAPGWGKRAPGWGKRAPGWGKRAPGWGKRTSPKFDSEEIAQMLLSLDDVDNAGDSGSFGDAEKRAPGWGKRAPGWGKRTLTDEDADLADASSDTDKRAPGWGKRAPGWGKRAPGWGKRAPGWGKRDQEKRAPGWGKRAPGWGKRDTEKRAPGWGKRNTQGHNAASTN